MNYRHERKARATLSTPRHADEVRDHMVSSATHVAAAGDEPIVEDSAVSSGSEGSLEVLGSGLYAAAEPDSGDEFLTPGQVAALFHVTAKTVGRWAIEGKIGYITTVGGHRRYRRTEIHALLRARSDPKTV